MQGSFSTGSGISTSYGNTRIRSATSPGKRIKTLDSAQLTSVDWKLEVALALDRESNEWEAKTLKASLKRMEMFEWLSAQPSMRDYMKNSFTYGQAWAPTAWRS